MKYAQWIGVIAAVILIIACFLPWTFHPDLQKNFTGFFSENNIYGKPGKVLIVLAILATTFFILPKVWAKRWNLLITALLVAYGIKSFILFSGCYGGICPQKKEGIWMMLISCLLMLLMAMFPDMKLKEKETSK